MNLSIFGTGYVGLVTGACLAEVGHNVICIDIDQNKINNLNKNILPIWEPGLAALVERNLSEGRLHFTTDVAAAVKHAEIQFIAVGTPPNEDGSADLQYVLAVAKSIARYMQNYKVIINKSTVPVGTADKVSAKIAEVLAAKGQEIESAIKTVAGARDVALEQIAGEAHGQNAEGNRRQYRPRQLHDRRRGVELQSD